MEKDKTFKALIEEYGSLREEMSGVNKNQFQLAAAVTLSVAGGFGAWKTFLNQEPILLLFLGLLCLGQIVFALEFRLRTKYLSQRVAAVERQLRAVCGTEYVLRWESQYVPNIFSGDIGDQSGSGFFGRMLSCGRAILIRAMHAFFLVPIVLIYSLCVRMVWVVNRGDAPFWTALSSIVLVLVFVFYYIVQREISRRINDEENGTIEAFKNQVANAVEEKQ